MSLPSGYKRLEYIQSSGTQWIDTGFKPNQNTRIKMDCNVIGFNSRDAFLFGARIASGNTAFCLAADDANTRWFALYGNAVQNPTGTCTGKHSIDFNQNVLTLDGKNFTFAKTTFQSSYNLLLFATITNGNVDSQRGKMAIYSCQIYDNVTLIRDYIPCQTTSGEIGLWDDVNSVFYDNAGTGTFTAGSVIAIAADKSEITKLEYIKSSGTQWIDTGFKPNQDTRVVIECNVISFNSRDMFLFGARVSAGNTAFYIAADDTNERWFVSYGNEVLNPSGTCIGHHSIDMNKNSVSIDGAITTLSTSTFQSASNLLLFATNTAGSVDSQRGTMNLYSCQIYDNGTLIRDYIAAKLSDGTVGLYDKLSGLLYINAGTGTFEAGPSSLNLPVNIGGTWKDANEAFVNIGGTWKTVEAAFVNIGGTWKELG